MMKNLKWIIPLVIVLGLALNAVTVFHKRNVQKKEAAEAIEAWEQDQKQWYEMASVPHTDEESKIHEQNKVILSISISYNAEDTIERLSDLLIDLTRAGKLTCSEVECAERKIPPFTNVYCWYLTMKDSSLYWVYMSDDVIMVYTGTPYCEQLIHYFYAYQYDIYGDMLIDLD